MIELKIGRIVALALVVGTVIPALLVVMLLFSTQEKGIVAAAILVGVAWSVMVGCWVEAEIRKLL